MAQASRESRPGPYFAGLFSWSSSCGLAASHWLGVRMYVPSARVRRAVTALALIPAPLQPTYATTPGDGSHARVPLPPCTDDRTAAAPWTVPAGVARSA